MKLSIVDPHWVLALAVILFLVAGVFVYLEWWPKWIRPLALIAFGLALWFWVQIA